MILEIVTMLLSISHCRHPPTTFIQTSFLKKNSKFNLLLPSHLDIRISIEHHWLSTVELHTDCKQMLTVHHICGGCLVDT